MKNGAIILFLMCVGIACGKLGKENTIVNGIARSAADELPYANYTVILKELKSTYPGVEVSIVESIITDDNGLFKFEFEAKKSSRYKYEIELEYNSDNFMDIGKDRISIEKGQNQSIILELAEYATVKFEPLGLENLGNEDEIFVKFSNNYYDNQNFFYNKGPISFNNGKLDVIAGEYILKIELIKNGISSLKDTTAFLEKNQTNIFKFNVE